MSRRTILVFVLALLIAPIIIAVTAALSAAVVHAAPIEGTFATVGSSITPKDQLVVVKILPHPGRSLTISIYDGTNTFRYNGQTVGTAIGFHAQREGEHTLIVKDADSGQMLETLYFLVQDPTPITVAPVDNFAELLNNTNASQYNITNSTSTNNTANATTPTSNNTNSTTHTTTNSTINSTTTNNTAPNSTTISQEIILPTRTRLVETDKQHYAIGEQVRITLSVPPEDLENLKLNIVNGLQVLRFIGDMQQEMVFEPRSSGAYRVVISSEAGDAIDSFVFVVDEPITQELLSNNTNSTSIIIDNPVGNSIDNSNTAAQQATLQQLLSNNTNLTDEQVALKNKLLLATEFKKTKQTLRITDSDGNPIDGEFVITSRRTKEAYAAPTLDAQSFTITEPVDVEFTPTNQTPYNEPTIKRVKVNNLVGSQLKLGVDEVLTSTLELPSGMNPKQKSWINAYAVDPTLLNASNVTITVTATGTELYVCKDWDYANNACLGSWVKLRDVTPGENYTLTLDSADPGFGESIPIPSAGWSKTTTTPNDLVTIKMCSDDLCTQTATNFLPGDTVYIWVNSSNGLLSDLQGNQLDIYPGSDPNIVATYAYTCQNPGGDSVWCRLNFTIPEEWGGWYYIDSDLHRLAGGTRYVNFRTPFTVGDEPVAGDRLQFFADPSRTRPADKFGRNYQVYVSWDANIGVYANISSNAAIKSPHYSPSTGFTRIANTSITFTNRTGPYLFNFSMPATLSDGYGGWYYFEPNLTKNSTENIPDGPVIYGRMFQYLNNTAPNLTSIQGNSPAPAPVSVGMLLMWNTTLNDSDEIDKHALYICNSSTFNYTTFSCAGTTICKNEIWSLGKNISCSIPANRNMSFNNTGYAFICDPWNCSTSIQTNYSVYNDSLAPTVTLITPINPTTSNDFAVTFNYVPEDDYGFVNCSLYTDAFGSWRAYNITDSITNGTNNYLSFTFPDDGAYVWNVLCMDYAGNKAFGTSNYTLYIQGPQIIRLTSPPNDTYTVDFDMNFTYNVSYSANMDACSLIINNSAVMNDSPVNIGETRNFSYTFPTDGAFEWNVWCNNTDGMGVYGDGVYNASIPRMIYIDTTDPIITLNLPTHNSISNESTVYFTYTPSDNFGIKNCTLYVDDAPVETRTTVQNNANLTTPYIIENGVHYWKAQCFDFAGNSGLSVTNIVTINASTTGTGFTLYETNLAPGSYANYTTTANINLSTAIDNTENRVAYALSGGGLFTYASAPSLPFMTNGILINPNAVVNFSGYFSAQTANNGYVTWKFYKRVGTTDILICDYGNDYTGGRVISATAKAIYRASCNAPNNYTRINGNESVKLVVNMYNSNNARRTFTHFFDNTSSYVLFNFTRLGFLSTNLSSPTINLTVGLNDTFNVTCKVNCTGGSCINTQVFLETNASGLWVKLNATSTPVILNSTDPNPHNLSTVVFPGNTTTFKIIANKTGDLLIRCNATSNYSNVITTSSVKISVQNVGAPTIILTSPTNNSYVSSINVSLNYTPSSSKNINNCSLFINGAYNKTMNVTKDITNTFNLTSPPDAKYNWLVSCIDSSGRVGNSSQYTFTIDRIAPQATLTSPSNNSDFSTASIQFFWTATDNVDTSLNCNLTIDGRVNVSNIVSLNDTTTNKNVSGFSLGEHGWNITCIDDAGNSNWSETRFFNITNIPPNVTNLAPTTNSWTNANDIIFNYNISEPDAPVYDYNKNYSAMIVYRSTTLSGANFPKYRTWNGATWSGETEMATTGSPLRWIKMASSTSQQRPWEKIALTISNDAGIDAYVWDGGAWSVTNNLFTTTAASAAYRDFDVIYEKKSGRAIAVANYNSATATEDWEYRIWNGTAWSATTIMDDPSYGGDALISYMHLVSSATTNDLALAYLETNSDDARVILWNGTGWHSQQNITINSPTSTTDAVGVAFESLSNKVVAVASEGTLMNYVLWNGTAWNQSGQFDPNTAAANTVSWLTLKPNPTGNQIMLTTSDAGNDLATTLWSNGAWSGNTLHDGGTDNVASRVFDYAWEPTGSKGLLMWGTATLYITARPYTGAWGTTSNITTSSANSHAWVSLYTNPSNKTGDVKILGAMEEAGSNALGSIRWVGTAPAISVNQFTTTQGTAAYQTYDMAFDNYPQSTNIIQYYPLANCSVYLNGIYNTSNRSKIYLEQANNITVTNIPEGTTSWYVNCSDTDGRSSNSTPWTIKIDRTPPTINLTYPLNGSNLTTFNLNFTFTAWDNVATNLVCNLTIDGMVNITNIAATNNTNMLRTVNGLSDTVHYWNVTCSDSAGNLNTSSTYSFNISAPPVVRLITPTNASYVNNINVTFIYNVTENDQVLNCSLFFDGIFNQTNQTRVNLSRLNNFTINNVTTGVHNWQVLCIDNMFQQGISQTYNFTVDRGSPQISLHIPENNTIWESRTVLFNFSAIDDVDTILTCNVSRKGPEGVITTSNIATPNGQWRNITQTSVPDGYHIWNVTCVDDALNSNISALFAFNVSAIANVTPIFPAAGMFNNTPNMTFIYFVYQSSGIANCSLYIENALNNTDYSITNNAQNNFTLTNLSDGTYFWNVSCYDNLNRISWTPTRNFTIEATPPMIVLYAPNESEIVNNNTVSFNYTAIDMYSPSMYCNLSVNGTKYFLNTNVVNGTTQSSKVTLRGGNASYNWNVTCNDRAGNQNYSETRNFWVIAPPAITLVSPNNNALVFGNTTFTYRVLDPYGLINCSLLVDEVIFNSTNSPINNSNNNIYAEGILGGTHNWTVGCYDIDGDYGTATPRIISNDQNPPVVFSEFPENGNYTPFSSVLFGWNATDDLAAQLSCSVYIDSVNRSTKLSNNGTSTNTTITGITDNAHWWNVTCFDNGGNSNTSAARSLIVNQTPTLTIQAPVNNYQTNVSAIPFNFTPSDNDGFTNCTLYINASQYAFNTTTINNSNLNSITATLATGKYYWSITCIDNGTYKNRNMSADRNITINLLPPLITLNSPSGGFASTDSWVVFNWTGYETFLQSITCNLTIDGSVSATNVATAHASTTARNITNINDSNNHHWNVSCIDLAGNYNISETRQFSVQEAPKITLNIPANNTRTNNATMNFTYTPTDNSGMISSCSLIINGNVNATNTTIFPGVQNNFSVSGFGNGTYYWLVNCTDPSGNTGTVAQRTLLIDQIPPVIVVYDPANNSDKTEDVMFNWTAYDSAASISCNLTLDGVVNTTVIASSGAQFYRLVQNITFGTHYWNLTCTDDFGQSNTSATYQFTIQPAELYTNESMLRFNNTNPNENETVLIRANITNSGGVDVANVTVAFWDGLPASGGLYIGNVSIGVAVNQTVQTSMPWNITLGMHTIFVSIDPEGAITENTKDNNNATKNLSVLRVAILAPPNGSTSGTATPQINFTAQNFSGGEFMYRIFVDGNANGQTGMITDNTTMLLTINALTEGLHRIIVQANDAAKVKNSTALSIIIDNSPPVGAFITLNNTFFTASPLNVTFRINDTYDANIEYVLFVDGVQNNISIAQNATYTNGTLTGLSDGSHIVTLQGKDDANNTQNNTPITIYVDGVAPTISMDYPPNGATFNTRTVSINFTPSDTVDTLLQCNLSFDGNVIRPYLNITNGSQYNLTLVNIPEGTHTWNVACWDGNNAVNQVNNLQISPALSFNVYINPVVSLVAPPNNTLVNTPTVTFYYNVSDETGIANCSIFLNGTLTATEVTANIVNNATNNFTLNDLNNTYSWYVLCVDSSVANLVNATENRTITIDLVAPTTTTYTTSYTWFNTSTPRINITSQDNFASTINWTAFVDGNYNSNGTVTNGASTLIQLSTITDGLHTIIIQGKDAANNAENSSSILIYIDTAGPVITLLTPPNDTNLSITSTTLNFTVTDNLAAIMPCNLTYDGNMVASYNLTNASYGSYDVAGAASGYHYWNVTCIDNASNKRTSATFRFFINMPDLAITSDNITFSNSTPIENQTIQINATVFNIGMLDDPNVTIRFFSGDPSSGGIPLGQNFTANLSIGTNTTVSIYYNATIGLQQIYVLVNGSNSESNYSNNKAHKDFWVGLFEVFAGSSANNLQIGDASFIASFSWNESNVTGSNVFVADSESTIAFTRLQAIGRNTTNGTSVGNNDFAEIDTKLGTTTLNDSINRTFTIASVPKLTRDIIAFKNSVNNVPIINSTNTSSFITGIVWDMSDGGSFYTGAQDIAFVTVMNQSQVGRYGTYDYEIAIPAKLRDYVAGGGTVTFYTEIK